MERSTTRDDLKRGHWSRDAQGRHGHGSRSVSSQISNQTSIIISTTVTLRPVP